ncbi:MAG: GNAT family N-acetyltransferase [Nakamurella sp.]
MPTSVAELAAIESYYDTVPRASATAEQIGPFTLFVSSAPFPFYARPCLTSSGGATIGPAEISAVRARQRELGVPEAFEWVDELRPELGAVLRSAGLVVYRLPLMVHLGGEEPVPPPAVRIRMLTADDVDLPSVQVAIGLGFTAPGTAIGTVGDTERVTAEAAMSDAYGPTRERIAAGCVALAGAFAGVGAVGGGSHSPRGEITEITGVATLPAYRRRGIGAAVTARLTADAVRGGVRTCFLSAGSPEVARIYARAGFRRVGTACVAGAPA